MAPRYVACPYCGTSVKLRGLAGALECPNCGSPLPLPREADRPVEPEHVVDRERVEALEAAAAEVDEGPVRSRGLPYPLVLISLPFLYGAWVVATGGLFELKAGVPLPVDEGEIWLGRLLVAPLVAGMMATVAILSTLLVLHWVRVTTRPSLTMALLATLCAVLAVALDGAYATSTLRAAGEAAWTGGWGMEDLVGPLHQAALESVLAIAAVVLTVNGLTAALIDLLRGRARFGCGGVFVAGLHAVGSVGVLVALAWLGTRLWSDGRVVVTLHALRDGASPERVDAAASLARGGDFRALKDLTEAAKRDPDPAVRRAAIHTLSAIGGEREADALLDLVDDPDPSVVRAVAAALGDLVQRVDLGDARRRAWASALREPLAHDSADIRAASADVLIALGPIVTSYVTPSLSAKGDTRIQALRILAEVGDDDAVGTLLWHLDDPEVQPVLLAVTRRAGAGTLVRSAFLGAAPVWYKIERPVHEVLLAVGQGGTDSLVEAACDDQVSSDARAYAWGVAVEVGGPQAGDRAIACTVAQFASDDLRTRERARYTLSRIGKPAVGPIVEALDDLPPDGQGEAMYTLRVITRTRQGADPQRWEDWWRRHPH